MALCGVRVCVCVSVSLSLSSGQGWAVASLCGSSAHMGAASNLLFFLRLSYAPWCSQLLVGPVQMLLLFQSMWSDVLSALSDC